MNSNGFPRIIASQESPDLNPVPVPPMADLSSLHSDLEANLLSLEQVPDLSTQRGAEEMALHFLGLVILVRDMKTRLDKLEKELQQWQTLRL